MSEMLLAVIIGGVVASIVPVASLIAEHRRWKLEKKLEHLRAERSRLEKLISETLKQLSKAMDENHYSPEMLSDITALMPRSATERLRRWILEESADKTKKYEAYLEISYEMKKALPDIDKKIEKLIDA